MLHGPSHFGPGAHLLRGSGGVGQLAGEAAVHQREQRVGQLVVPLRLDQLLRAPQAGQQDGPPACGVGGGMGRGGLGGGAIGGVVLGGQGRGQRSEHVHRQGGHGRQPAEAALLACAVLCARLRMCMQGSRA